MSKILIITLSNIGDAVMTTPVLEYLYKTNKKFSIDIVCDLKSYEIFKNCPYVKDIYLKNKLEGTIGNIKLLLELRKKNYEIAVDLRTDLFLYFINAKAKYFKVKNNNIHSVLKHFSALKVDLKKMPYPKIWIPKSSIEKSKELIKKRKKIIVLGIGANSQHKIWPVENYLQLLENLKDKFENCILLGDKRDNIYARKFVDNTKMKTLNFCGKLSLMDTAAIIAQADYFIGNDSGLGHIASALAVPSFTIFGRENLLRYHPWGGKAHWYQHPNKNILSIEPKVVFEKILETI